MSDYSHAHHDRAVHEQVIQQLYPGAAVSWIGFGEANSVAQVGKDKVIRFPKTERAKRQLLYEAEILGRLDGKMSISIPKVIKIDPELELGIFSFIPGKQLTNKDIAALSFEKQRAVGQALASFVTEINTILSLETVRSLQTQFGLGVRSWDTWFQETLTEAGKRTSPYLSVYERTLQRLTSRYPEGFDDQTMVIYGDAHSGNFIFDGHDVLVGVIDFGQFGVGNMYREAKQLYSLGSNVVSGLLDKLDGRYGAVQEDVLRLLCIQYELALLIAYDVYGEPSVFRAEVAKKLLNQWLGEGWLQS